MLFGQLCVGDAILVDRPAEEKEKPHWWSAWKFSFYLFGIEIKADVSISGEYELSQERFSIAGL